MASCFPASTVVFTVKRSITYAMNESNNNSECANASVEEPRHDCAQDRVSKAVLSNSRKRTQSVSRSSSSSSSPSSSDSTDSASSSDRKKKRGRHHKRRGGKHSRKSRKDNRQMQKLFREVSALRNQITLSSSVPCGSAEPASVVDNDALIDDNVSGILYNDSIDAYAGEPTRVQLPFNFDIETKLKEPAVPKAPDNLLKALQDVQYFNKSEWSEVRYSEVQKSYCHTPGFVDLEANEEIRAYDQLRHLAYADKAYAALTFCALKQRQALSSTLTELLSWAHAEQDLNFNSLQDKITEVFSNGDFQKVSSDLLQLICGHRAEILQMRRDGITNHVRDPLIKATLRKIPPSDRHLFENESFTAALEKMGGVKKAFVPLTKPTSGSASQAGPNKAARHPPQGSALYHGPSQGTSHGCCTFVPHPHYQYRQSSQDCYHDRPQRQNNQSDRRTAPTSNNRGSFRSRGGHQNYKQQNQGKGNRKRPGVSSDYNSGNKNRKY